MHTDMTFLDALPGLLILAALLAGYLWVFFLPTRIVRRRNHPQQDAIYAVNVLFGWTFIGWALALVWATWRGGLPAIRLRHDVYFHLPSVRHSQWEA